MFATATVSDVNEFHEVFNVLQLSHSFCFETGNIIKLDAMAGMNSNAIANFSSTVKGVVIHYRDKFKQVTRDILLFNVSIHKQSEPYMVIRQLEFAVLQLTQQLSELMDVIQCILLGKLLVNLLNQVLCITS